MWILVCYAYHHASSHHFDKSGIHNNHLSHLAFSFVQVTKFFGAEFRDPRMSGKVHQQYDHEVPSHQGPHLQDGMKELLSVSIRSWHFMAIDMLSTIFMLIVHQQRKVGKPYCNPKHKHATQHAEAAQRAQTREIELATRQAAAAATQQVAAAQVLASETPAHPGIQVPGQLQWTYLTEALVEHTSEEQEQYNYSLTLSHNLGYSPDDAVVIRSPGIDWDETGTVTTDMEMTDAMTGFTLDSLADNREVLCSQRGMSLGPCPSVLPNLQMQIELDKLRRGDGQNWHIYSDTWSDTSLYQSRKDAMAKLAQQRQSHSTDTRTEMPHK